MKTYSIIIGIFIVAMLLALPHCTDVDGATHTLKVNNYKPIHVGGYAWFNGDKGDVYRTKFTAIAPNGDTVTGVVTSGFFKGHTLRVD